jgi:hypothetical protein
MSELFRCDDKDTLTSYLYDEIDPVIRRRVEEHLKTCAACASEVAALQGVRVDLAQWTPPEPQLEFAIVSKHESRQPRLVPPAAWWSGVPVWARAAAAVLVIAAGFGIANVQVTSGPEGTVVRTGWMAPSSAQPVTVDNANADWKPALAALAAELRSEMSHPRSTPPAAVAAASRPNDDIMRVVQAMIAQSESRQRQELALRLTQFNRDVNVQRSADLVKIDQMLGTLDGRTGAMDARQRQLLNYIQRVSNPQQ